MDPSWDWLCFWLTRSVVIFIMVSSNLGDEPWIFRPWKNSPGWYTKCVLKSIPKREGYDDMTYTPKDWEVSPCAIRFWSHRSFLYPFVMMDVYRIFVYGYKIFNCNNRWISSMLTLAWVKLNQLKTGRSDSVGTDPQINGLVEEHIYRHHGV